MDEVFAQREARNDVSFEQLELQEAVEEHSSAKEYRRRVGKLAINQRRQNGA